MVEARQSVSPALRSSGRGRVVVVGAGIGGLACAIDLARSGHEVLVLESAAQPGGKLREVRIGSHLLDAGPTVFTMRWVFDELFDDAGTTLGEYLALRPLETLARHAWCADERLDLFADVERSVDAIGRFAGAAEARRFVAFSERAGAVYRTLETPFLRGSRPTPLSLAARAGWRGLPNLWRIAPFATLWSSLGDHFHDPRLRQLFGRYATYCGSSPFAAPATLMLVAHVEQQGVWRVEGGMHRLALALAGLLRQLGGTIEFNRRVDEIVVRDGRAFGVEVADDGAGRETIDAGAVVFNGDVAALASGHLGLVASGAAPPVAPADRSLSAFTWSVVGRAVGFPLERHNVFFGADYRAEFDAVFGEARLPTDPTVYVCAQDRDEGRRHGDTALERFLCLVNAPPRGDLAPLPALEIERCRERMTRALARCGLTIEAAPNDVTTTTPSDFDRLWPGSGGALYGRASHGWAASFRRPGARSRIPGLYLAGGTVHPGPGVPMAALSGRQAAASVIADRTRARRSIAQSPDPAMPGGMPMP
jgi:1-hydroxycarotenoid 3,4-desaturase